MRKSKFTDEQIVGILQETDRDPVERWPSATGERAVDLHLEKRFRTHSGRTMFVR